MAQRACHFSDPAIERFSDRIDVVEIDDMAPVNSHEKVRIESLLHLGDRQRTEQIGCSIGHIGVMGIGVDRDILSDIVWMARGLSY